ncbi:hypothetical protein, partial [Serratia marcescens]|uniref:hypothetical protein n=1 Tax=Serratia marcescens TaxID=615 RepID=UPI001BCA6932
DMVIAASMWRAQRWRKMNPCEAVSAIMTIKEKRVGRATSMLQSPYQPVRHHQATKNLPSYDFFPHIP